MGEAKVANRSNWRDIAGDVPSMAAPWPLNSAISCVPDSPEAWTCLDELNQSDSETPRHIRGWVIPTLAFRKEIC